MDVFILDLSSPPGIARVDRDGHAGRLATIPDVDGLWGIALDSVGRFDYRLLVAGMTQGRTGRVLPDAAPDALQGTVPDAGPDGAPPRVDILGRHFAATAATTLVPGQEVTVVLRPEAILVAPRDAPAGSGATGAAADGVLEGTVRRAAFLGPVVDYEIALRGPDAVEGPIVTVHDRDVQRAEPLPEGAAVVLRPLADRLYVLPGE